VSVSTLVPSFSGDHALKGAIRPNREPFQSRVRLTALEAIRSVGPLCFSQKSWLEKIITHSLSLLSSPAPPTMPPFTCVECSKFKEERIQLPSYEELNSHRKSSDHNEASEDCKTSGQGRDPYGLPLGTRSASNTIGWT
jgi:hypothetical protein